MADHIAARGARGFTEFGRQVKDVGEPPVYIYDRLDEPTRSILEVPGAKDIAIEFVSFSKSHSMAGWRVCFACGNQQMIHALKRIYTRILADYFAA